MTRLEDLEAKDIKDLTPEEIIEHFHLEPYQMSIDLNTHEVTYYY